MFYLFFNKVDTWFKINNISNTLIFINTLNFISINITEKSKGPDPTQVKYEVFGLKNKRSLRHEWVKFFGHLLDYFVANDFDPLIYWGEVVNYKAPTLEYDEPFNQPSIDYLIYWRTHLCCLYSRFKVSGVLFVTILTRTLK